MLASIASYFTGRAAKAGVAALMGAIGAPGAIAGAEMFTTSDMQLTLVGYVVVGAIGGLMNWATVYWKANAPSSGLY
jgi:hypothetical protein